METLPNSLAHPGDDGHGGCGGGGGPSRNNDRLLSTHCISQCGVVGNMTASQSVCVQILVLSSTSC